MNRHTKLALFMAPLLLVGGYIASDQYLEYKANKPKIFQLSAQGECKLFAGKCILGAGDMLLSITDEAGVTKVNTSYPVDSVAVSLVYNSGSETIYELKEAGNAQYWERDTDIREAVTQAGTAEKLRVVAKIKGSVYLSEFSPSR